MMQRKNEIVDVSFKLALLIIRFSEELEASRKFVIAKQLLRSGTSIGANIRESQSAESKADFVHKLKIAHKESLETQYWIDLIKESESYPNPSPQIENLLISVVKLLNKIIATSKSTK